MPGDAPGAEVAVEIAVEVGWLLPVPDRVERVTVDDDFEVTLSDAELVIK